MVHTKTDIPKILDVAELQLELIKLVEHLTKQNLFILIDKCKPVKALLSVCYTIADAKEIHIGWITDKPLKAPLQKFLPNQPNLFSAIQSWINKID
ncbi:hypothetical protein NIES4071_86670 [Calothrix sp. NIES-4071]|nr:hypothetical protein NIES4071_86670 [Calothrix sp. NIES-4071]BAZ62934.1 hypothetical protein NIES4105_86600 [Calothrix sp. NIES-4105]